MRVSTATAESTTGTMHCDLICSVVVDAKAIIIAAGNTQHVGDTMRPTNICVSFFAFVMIPL